MDQVDKGKVKLPRQSVPSTKVVEAQQKAGLSGKKDYDKDLEQVSGQKGSNDGGLFKDKKLQTFHYVKWPNSEVRAKVEALTASMYAYAQVPAPTVRQVTIKGKPAVISDWIEDAKPMTTAAMAKHKDVRTGFVADAWLANWDVVGLSADNIVKGPGAKAYRIDVGGSMLFRAQGKPKAFEEKVGELETLRNPSVNPKAAEVFEGMTAAELREGAKRVGAITDGQIDEAVDAAQLPKKSADYPSSQFGAAANDLPKLLKARLKARRDYVGTEILYAAEKAEALAKEKEKLAKEAQKDSGLKLVSVNAVVKTADNYTPKTLKSSSKWALTKRVMRHELGEKDASGVTDAVQAHYSTWKGATNTGKGAVLRYAAGEMDSTGRREVKRLKKFQQFLVKEKLMTKSAAASHAAHLDASTGTEQTKRLVDGLKVTRKQNALTMKLKHSGKDTLILYRGWKVDQVKYLKLKKAKVGQMINLEDPPLYSWSLNPKVGHNFGHGSLVTKAEVPIDSLVLSDTVNSVGSYEGENEVLFKGVPTLAMEVVKTQ